MSLGTNGASAAQLEDPKHENEFVAAEQTAIAKADVAAATQATQDAADGALMAAAASDSPASPAA